MQLRQFEPELFISGQITPADIEAAAKAGIRTIVCNRPDGEEPGQPAFETLARAAQELGIETLYLPVGGDRTAQDQAAAFAEALATRPRPMLAFCRTGNRSQMVTAAARALPR
ncbi:TIGR01244 family sulfur transferase, partial [Novosphingobium sp. 1949]